MLHSKKELKKREETGNVNILHFSYKPSFYFSVKDTEGYIVYDARSNGL